MSEAVCEYLIRSSAAGTEPKAECLRVAYNTREYSGLFQITNSLPLVFVSGHVSVYVSAPCTTEMVVTGLKVIQILSYRHV